MQSLLITTPQRVIKIPYTPGAFREALRERRKIKEVKNDPFFRHFLPHYIFVGPISSTISLPLFSASTDTLLIDAFFNNAFYDCTSWKLTPLDRLVDPIFFEFMRKNNINDTMWLKFTSTNFIPESSAHGDLHAKNILIEDGQVRLIDWSNYSVRSSRYFDLINFYVTQPERSWIHLLERLYNTPTMIPSFGQFGVTLSLLTAFAIWRTGKELRELIAFHNMDSRAIYKYTVFLRSLQMRVI